MAVEEEVHVELLALTADAQQTLGYCARALQLNSRALMNAADGLAEKEAAVSVTPKRGGGAVRRIRCIRFVHPACCSVPAKAVIGSILLQLCVYAVNGSRCTGGHALPALGGCGAANTKKGR